MASERFALWRSFAAVCLFAFAAPALALLPIQSWQTQSGARVYFVENHDLPMLDLSVEFPAGSAFDTRDKAGLASLTRHMLRLGAGGMSEDDIARRLADVGAQLGGTFDTDRAGVALRTLTSSAELEQALELFGAVLQRPDFPQAVLEREQARIAAAIKDSLTKPETLLGRAFFAAIYGAHPYGLPASGEAATVSGLKRDDLVAFHRRRYTAGQAVVALIGDLTRARAAAIAERVTAGLARDATADAVPAVEPLAAAELKVIPHPATQSHVLIGMPVLTRDDPDYFALFLGNHILGGGGFASRITDEVRQKRGLAYSAYSVMSPLRQPGPFMIGLQTQRGQVGEALAVVRETLAKFVADGPTEDELTKARQNIVGGFPLRIDSNRKIHEYLGMIGFYRLPLTYLDDFVPQIEKVTVAAIRDAFRRRVDPARMVTVVVGAEPGSVPAR